MTTLAIATHCGCVRPSANSWLRRRNSIEKRSTPVQDEEPAEDVHQPEWSVA